MYNNPKNNIVMLENTRQKRLTILEYFNAPKIFKVDNDNKYMHRNVPEFLSLFSDIFQH